MNFCYLILSLFLITANCEGDQCEVGRTKFDPFKNLQYNERCASPMDIIFVLMDDPKNMLNETRALTIDFMKEALRKRTIAPCEDNLAIYSVRLGKQLIEFDQYIDHNKDVIDEAFNQHHLNSTNAKTQLSMKDVTKAMCAVNKIVRNRSRPSTTRAAAFFFNDGLYDQKEIAESVRQYKNVHEQTAETKELTKQWISELNDIKFGNLSESYEEKTVKLDALLVKITAQNKRMKKAQNQYLGGVENMYKAMKRTPSKSYNKNVNKVDAEFIKCRSQYLAVENTAMYAVEFSDNYLEDGMHRLIGENHHDFVMTGPNAVERLKNIIAPRDANCQLDESVVTLPPTVQNHQEGSIENARRRIEETIRTLAQAAAMSEHMIRDNCTYASTNGKTLESSNIKLSVRSAFDALHNLHSEFDKNDKEAFAKKGGEHNNSDLYRMTSIFSTSYVQLDNANAKAWKLKDNRNLVAGKLGMPFYTQLTKCLPFWEKATTCNIKALMNLLKHQEEYCTAIVVPLSPKDEKEVKDVMAPLRKANKKDTETTKNNYTTNSAELSAEKKKNGENKDVVSSIEYELDDDNNQSKNQTSIDDEGQPIDDEGQPIDDDKYQYDSDGNII